MTKLKNVKVNNASGFSLVELMVVVAIIGILASVAVPQFQKFTFKARMTEAKAGLTSLYTAEKAFYGEWSQYDTRFQIIGYAPEGNYSFNIGFTGADVASTNWAAVNPTAPATVHNNVRNFCTFAANSTRCKNMQTSSAVVASPAAGFLTATFAANGLNCTAANPAAAPGPQFKACASATAAINPEGTVVNLAINHSKDLRSDVP